MLLLKTKNNFRSEGTQEYASPLPVCLSEKVHKLAVAETEQAACDSGRLCHLNLMEKHLTNSDRMQQTSHARTDVG